MRDSRKWTIEEEDFIRENYTDLSDEEMAEILQRTMRSVRVKRQRLGLFLYFQESSAPIKGEKWIKFDGTLEVSNKGRIRKDGNKYLGVHVHKTGYCIVSVNGKNQYLHRIVWEGFNGKIPEGYEIDHKDCNKLNNSLYNLEMVTHQENMKRA